MHTKFRAIFLAEGRVGLKQKNGVPITLALAAIFLAEGRVGLKPRGPLGHGLRSTRYSWPRVGLD